MSATRTRVGGTLASGNQVCRDELGLTWDTTAAIRQTLAAIVRIGRCRIPPLLLARDRDVHDRETTRRPRRTVDDHPINRPMSPTVGEERLERGVGVGLPPAPDQRERADTDQPKLTIICSVPGTARRTASRRNSDRKGRRSGCSADRRARSRSRRCTQQRDQRHDQAAS